MTKIDGFLPEFGVTEQSIPYAKLHGVEYFSTSAVLTAVRRSDSCPSKTRLTSVNTAELRSENT